MVAMKEKKESRIYLRINSEEKDILQSKANKYGLTVSEYLRQVSLQHKVINKNIRKELLYNLSRFGSNINQIAIHVNTWKDDTDKIQLLVVLHNIENELKELHKKC